MLSAGKPVALLAYLAVSPGRRASREHLLGLLWADLQPTQARHALRQAIWYLKQRVGDGGLATENGDLVLQAPLTTDRDTFLAAVDSERLEEAMKQYSGDFIPAFALPGGAEFEHWAEIERFRLRSIFLRTTEQLARRHLAKGRFGNALDLARRARDTDPHAEAGWRLLLEVLLSAGDRLGAAVEADALARMLREEGRPAEPATMSLCERAHGPEPHPSPAEQHRETRTLVAELIGREREFSVVLDAWKAARDGRSAHVHVTAPPGGGKTRLLTDLFHRLQAGGVSTTSVRANPGERDIPYALVGDLAKALVALPGALGMSPAAAGTLLGLNPSLSSHLKGPVESSTGGEVLRRRTLALSELATAVGDEKPFVIFIDDVHWSDRNSRQVLASFVVRARDSRCLMVTAARPSPEGHVSREDTIALVLQPFDAEQIAALMGSLGTVPADQSWNVTLPELLLRATRGSPLLVFETLRLGLERGWMRLSKGVWACLDVPLVERELVEGSALRHRVASSGPNERRLLLLLAVAGVPLFTSQLRHMLRPSNESLDSMLRGLERRGLIACTADTWLPGHDEIAEHAIDGAVSDEVRAAHSSLSGLFSDQSTNDPESMRRAIHHLIRIDDEVRAHCVAMSWVRYARRRRDWQPAHVLLDGLLSTEPDATQWRARLLKHLPLAERLGVYSPARRIALAAAVLVSLAVAAWSLGHRPPEPEALIFAAVRTPIGETRVYEIPVRTDSSSHNTAIAVADDGTDLSYMRARPPTQNLAPRPDGNAWAVTRLSDDDGGLDLYLQARNGRSRRLTNASGDDFRPDWAPDGALVVFETGRWNPTSFYDLAILDVAVGTVTPFLVSDSVLERPRWSPDGTRIAYQVRQVGESDGTLCWTSLDRLATRCYGEARPQRLVDWLDPGRLIVIPVSQDVPSLAVVDVENGDVTSVPLALDGILRRARVSPGASWIAVEIGDGSDRLGQWHVFPMGHPELIRPLLTPRGMTLYDLQWLDPKAPRNFIERLEIKAPLGPLPLTAPGRLLLRAWSGQGDPAVTRALTWRSSDTTVATVRANGVVIPQAVGSVTVTASAGGWRTDSIGLRIDSIPYRMTLSETWDTTAFDRWIAFGVPSPSLVTGPGGVASLSNRGDSSLGSGAFLRDAIDGFTSFGFDAMVSVPITAPIWQGVSTYFVEDELDSDFIPGRDKHHSENPYIGRLRWGASLPADPSRGGTMRVMCGDTGSIVPFPSVLDSERWWTLRFQVFQDGSCGIAVDGRPLGLHLNDRLPHGPLRLVVEGRSQNTRTLHGPIEVWTGVRGDMDWRSTVWH